MNGMSQEKECCERIRDVREQLHGSQEGSKGQECSVKVTSILPYIH